MATCGDNAMADIVANSVIDADGNNDDNDCDSPLAMTTPTDEVYNIFNAIEVSDTLRVDCFNQGELAEFVMVQYLLSTVSPSIVQMDPSGSTTVIASGKTSQLSSLYVMNEVIKVANDKLLDFQDPIYREIYGLYKIRRGM